MTDWDADRVTFSDQQRGVSVGGGGGADAGAGGVGAVSSTVLRAKYREFFRTFCRGRKQGGGRDGGGPGNGEGKDGAGGGGGEDATSAGNSGGGEGDTVGAGAQVFPYREQLLKSVRKGDGVLQVDLSDLGQWDETLLLEIQKRPAHNLPLLEAAAKEALASLVGEIGAGTAGVEVGMDDMLGAGGDDGGGDGGQNALLRRLSDIQVLLKSNQDPQPLRGMTAEHINQLIRVPGIVIGASKVKAKAVTVVIKCTKCGTVKRLSCASLMGSVTLPMHCDRGGMPNIGAEDCGQNPFVIMADNCEYIDQQTLKLQEAPEVVPTGEMPRHTLLAVDRNLVDRVSPGMRVTVMAISSLFTSPGQNKLAASAIRTPFMRVVGIEVAGEGAGGRGASFTPQEEEELMALARSPAIYEKFSSSIAPLIDGEYTVDIKRALACLLMGGSRKVLPDGVRLRGDVNVLLLGDPSTAKSQFLKFVEKVAPVGVYTSGKGSSAAGLTASVIRDAKGEFYLEGGAMVLADGGVICIDEFDKMRESDRVAIHEAMEQQTISIAKAGITTILNSRTSVLAAANPIFGRYDEMRSASENIDLMTTILSRFDLIFIVRDIRNEARDRAIARHVLNVHMNAGVVDSNDSAGEIDVRTMKKLVSYCRARCAPRLSEGAAEVLSSQYVKIRDEVRLRSQQPDADAHAVPITVRQLEALVRISEALAKMRLDAEATEADVQEAIRLFQVSTMSAAMDQPGSAGSGAAAPQQVSAAEDFLRRRIGLRITVNARKVLEESYVQGHTDEAVRRAIAIMVRKGELQELNQRKMLRRMR